MSTDLAALLDHLTPAEASALVARLPGARRSAMFGGPLPGDPDVRRTVLDWVVAHSSPADRTAVLTALAPSEWRVFADLAVTPDPAVRTAVYLHWRTPAAVRRRMLAGGPGTLPVPAELRTALLTTSSRHLLGPARDAADPAIAAHARRKIHGPRCQPPPQDPAGVHAWLRVTPAPQEDPERARSPRRPPGPSSRQVRRRLAAIAFEAWTPADWAALLALHQEHPLDSVTVENLTAHPYCPADIAMAWMYPDVHASGRPGPVLAGLRAGTFTARDLYERAEPATAVLTTLASGEYAFVLGQDPAVRAANARLGALVRAELGGDPARWHSLLVLLRSGFPGTVPELLRAAATAPALQGTVLPERPEAPSPREANTSPWVFLLSLAEPEHVAPIVRGVAAALDAADRESQVDPVVEEFLKAAYFSDVPGPLLAAFAEVAPEADRVKLARSYRYRPDLVDAVLALDDPALNAGLILGYAAAPHLRSRVLNGVSYATGEPGSLPVHPAVFTDAPTYPVDARVRHLLHGDDADELAALLASTSMLPLAYRVAGCRRLAERGRLDLVAGLVAGTASDGKPHAHLARIGAELSGLMQAGDPAAVAAALRAMSRTLFLAELVATGHTETGAHMDLDDDLDWAAAAEILRARPPGRAWHGLVATLARAHSLPDEMARLAFEKAPAEAATHLAMRSPDWARAALDVPLRARGAWSPGVSYPAVWPEQCLRSGKFGIGEFVARARPAGAMLDVGLRRPAETEGARAQVRALMDRCGPQGPEVLAVAAALLDEFPGTLPELFALAEAAAAPAAGSGGIPGTAEIAGVGHPDTAGTAGAGTPAG
ncbi:hypothetical protein [Yinghuangia soli]|uniref:Uncharacterized protein n=1 Tax=Yinghuangia soli TaxID=2908204 RepID=A0AA41Q2H6_9ACTN|nr:hypothetical protein [Yinghuangia soli]MCF2530335.1 hypothetical protein [Yinghuangia soli]